MIIALDIGATNLTVGGFSSSGILLGSFNVPTPKDPVPKSFLDFLFRTIQKCAVLDEELEAIGVGTCGIIREGVILYSPNTTWKTLPLEDALTQKFQVPVAVVNDADAFALGVFHYEFRDRFASLCGITLGTGLGGALIGNKGLFKNYGGISPEIGHMTVVADGRKCACGKKGCFEAYANEGALLRYYREVGGNVMGKTAKQLYVRFKKGEKEAITAFSRFGHYLGVGLSSLANVFDPEAIVLGGGLSRARLAFLESAGVSMKQNLISGLPIRPRIVVSRMLRKASILGAYHRAKEILQDEVY